MRNQIITQDLEEIAREPLNFDDLSGKTVLITGASGFFPAYLVETLLFLNEKKNLNIKIIGLVRNLEKAQKRFAHYQEREDLELDTQSLSHPLRFSGPIDFVIHAASQASPKYYGKDPVGTLMPNVIGTYHLLELAREKKSQGFLFFSSSEIYGQSLDREPLHEKSFGITDCFQVRACYAESKRMGETLCLSWGHQYRVPVKIMRPFHVYGPGMALDDGRVFADFVADIVAQRNIVMKSDGTATRSYCYLADATRAFFTIWLKGSNAEAYNVGNEAAQASVLDLAERLVKLFPERGLRVERWKAPEPNLNYLPSPISKLSPNTRKIQELGWSPRYSIEDGFRRAVQSYL